VRTPSPFKVEFQLPVGGVDPERADELLRLIGGLCGIAPTEWAQSVELPAVRQAAQVETMAPAAALRQVIEGRAQYARVWRSGDETAGDRIAVGYGPPLYRHWLCVWVVASLGQVQHEPLFVALSELLQPRHAWHVPDYEDAEGLQGTILEMALQRDFRMYGFEADSKDVTRAELIAPLLPRMPFAMPDPMGLPGRLGWLNYWRPDVATALGFPDAGKDATLLRWSYRTPSGAWLVKLTEDLLDLARPDHAEALAQAYWRFGKIGKRMRPAVAKAAPQRREAPAATADRLKLFIVRERDASGNWWTSATDPVRASSADEALRVYFARSAHGRAPRRGDTLSKLRDAYDALAVEVGLTMSADIEVAEIPGP
jgi:hypothetical protein